MNSITTLIICAVALFACSDICRLEVAANTNQRGETVELQNELTEDDDSELYSPDGGITDNWGRNNVLEDGVGNLVDPKTSPCRQSKDEIACRNCCELTGKAYKYTLSPGVKLRWRQCICFDRSPRPM